ncbi:MAG: gliding motility-associated C-terminal domain-containing protein [Flavobacteriia bacterium]|nr:gliding motility-associated C-terminal domain-containing protein [Flavobacteriia bacterium]
MKKIISLSFVLLLNLYNSINAQVINITDADQTPLTCANFNDGAAINFEDNGGAGNYPPLSDETITLCPDLPNGPKISVTFATNAGFSFDVDASDTIYIFDGIDINAPLLGKLNNGINPNGGSYSASFINNPSGCLTIRFLTDGSNEGTGFGANISCGNPPQPFELHIEAYINGQGNNALNPADTGYVDICLGDSVLLIAKPLFPYSLENNGFGYSQNIDNVNFFWETSNNWVGPNNDSIWFVPPQRSGYYMSLEISDAFPQTFQMPCKIRVSQQPIFRTTVPEDTIICINQQLIITGGATPQDTVGVQFPPGAFLLGGTIAGLTYLPDGSGQEYSTTINMDDFDSTLTFQNVSDLQNICLTMEHSYLGDLEVWLTCPNGTAVSLINSYDPGNIPGGFGGGGTFLGDADDNGNGTPGIGWEYCFSAVNNTLGTMGDELAAGNTLPTTISNGTAMNPDGVYLPDGNFQDLIGCPLNGDWTIHVRDNLGVDDGYIFEWGLYFNSALFPEMETYVNHLVDEYWMPNPTIISGLTDTMIVVQPNTFGDHFYTYQVIDNYGCVYDTTITINVTDFPVVDPVQSQTVCADQGFDPIDFTFTDNTNLVWVNTNEDIGLADSGFVDIPSFVGQNQGNQTSNALITAFAYIGGCIGQPITFNLTVNPNPTITASADDFICVGGSTNISASGANTYNWDNGLGAGDNHDVSPIDTTTYTVTGTDNNGCEGTDQVTIYIIDPPVVFAGNDTTICYGESLLLYGTGADNYAWTNGISDSVSFIPNIGTITYTMTGSSSNGCSSQDDVVVNVLAQPIPIITPSSTMGTPPLNVTFTNTSQNASTYTWDFGNGSSILTTTNLTEQNAEYSTIDVYTVVFTADNGVCSNDTTFQIIVINFDPVVLHIPNIFTPDGDKKNDVYTIGVENGAEFDGQIFNRWGNLMYEIKGLYNENDPNTYWDGTKDGKESTEGTYFITYAVKGLDGSSYDGHTYFHLQRKK